MGVNGFVAVDDIEWVNNDRCETKPAWADPEATTTQEPPTVTTEIPPSELCTAINMYTVRVQHVKSERYTHRVLCGYTHR